MAIKKTKSGWEVDIQPGGRGGKRIRKTLKTKGEAQRFEAHARTKLEIHRDWNPAPADQRTLENLADRWYEIHGKHLSDAKHRLAALKKIANYFGKNRKARDFSAADFAAYRNVEIEKGISAATTNRAHAYLRAMFNQLEMAGEWNFKNPMKMIKQLKIDEFSATWLENEQIDQLLKELEKSENQNIRDIAEICITTGARFEEAESLTVEQVQDSKLQFQRTKGKKNRSVPISETLAIKLKARAKTGRIFSGTYDGNYDAFEATLKKSKIILPAGQCTHVMRHTFAAHFVKNGGSILTLQKILGHASITTTMRYAHLQPDHLEQALTLNPLANNRNGQK